MSAKRSKHTDMMHRFDAQVKQYEEKINRQKRIIDRLLAATAAYADAVHLIAEDVKNVRDARIAARNVTAQVKEILAVEPDNRSADTKEN